jgi:hypothetical protein
LLRTQLGAACYLSNVENLEVYTPARRARDSSVEIDSPSLQAADNICWDQLAARCTEAWLRHLISLFAVGVHDHEMEITEK